MMNRGVIPSVAHMDSGIRMPDNNIEQYQNEKAREQWAITKQVRLKPRNKAKKKTLNNYENRRPIVAYRLLNQNQK